MNSKKLKIKTKAHRDIDRSRFYETLDKELHKIVREAGVGRRIADKLIKVWLKDGQQQYVLIHIPQGWCPGSTASHTRVLPSMKCQSAVSRFKKLIIKTKI